MMRGQRQSNLSVKLQTRFSRSNLRKGAIDRKNGVKGKILDETMCNDGDIKQGTVMPARDLLQ